MRVLSLRSAAAFESAAGSWMKADERTNNLILSRLHAERFSDDVKSWLVMEGDAPQLALLETPLNFVLSGGSRKATEYLAKDLEIDIAQFVGPAEVADSLAAHLRRTAGRTRGVSMDMTFYALDRVEPFSRAAGCLRAATSAELDELAPLAMAAEWEMHVVEERPDPAEIERTLRQAIDDGRQFVWVDGSTIRAIASYVSPFSHAGARNSWSVYTSGIPGARVWNCDHWFAGGEIVEGRPSLGGVVCG